MLNAIFNNANTVLEQQKRVQASTDKIYYRMPRGKLYVRSYVAVWGMTMVGTAAGIVALVRGQ
ncbi:hypothetical protein BDV98DRAFT_589536 [Pterulicium gracile]|uniref:Uncharacterized protein n=1 Tax=Pterulicium gracile TaxID=1884261 RepID=A0A5C3QZL2_9AGAR|nr:hypothetical protein BDV98DRAFT_589536 [Pterula gracilis]